MSSKCLQVWLHDFQKHIMICSISFTRFSKARDVPNMFDLTLTLVEFLLMISVVKKHEVGEREVKRDGPDSRVSPFRCVCRAGCVAEAHDAGLKEHWWKRNVCPMPLLAFSSPVWHDGRVCLPSCLAPWPMEHFSALQSEEGQVGAEPLGAPIPCMPADRAPGTVCSLACDYPSNCMGKPDNSHTQFAAKAAAPKTQRCAVANAKRASEGLGLFRATSTEMALVWCPQERFRRHCNPVSALRA